MWPVLSLVFQYEDVVLQQDIFFYSFIKILDVIRT